MRRAIFAAICAIISAGPVWAACQAGDIDLTGFTQTFSDEFASVSVGSTPPSKGAATWYYWPPYGPSGAYSVSQWDAAAFTASGSILQDKAFTDGSGNWHSGNLSSMDETGTGFAQMWGYFEARVKMPDSGTGTWPAFWLNQRNGILVVGPCNLEELDIFEWYGVSHDNVPGLIQQASHNWVCGGGQDQTIPYLYSPQTPMPDSSQPWAAFHIYGLLIKPDFITWYIDGVQTNQIVTPTTHVGVSPFYVMVDYALGGGWPVTGVVNNSHLDVDWVRVYNLPTVADFVKTDTTTHGNWIGVYGLDGYNVSQDVNILTPAYAQVSLSGASNYVWDPAPVSVNALSRPEAPASRIASTWFSTTNFTIDINITDGQTHQVSLYAIDYDNFARSQTINVRDAVSNVIYDTRTIPTGSTFVNGEYLVWNVRGHVKFEMIKTGPVNAVISGIFFK